MQTTLANHDVATRSRPSAASPVTSYLEQLHRRHAQTTAGSVATYIPELAGADPAWCGIALMTVDGTSYEIGDTRQPFTIQSISKPLTYGLALDDLGETAVRRRIGVEPTGDAFNSISLAPDSGSPLNPMVNAGAIAAASLIRGDGTRSPLDRIVDCHSAYAGHALTVDRVVFESERSSGHRNRAIGHLLRASGALDGDPDEALERYFAQCSLTVDGRDLATIAATLANGGVNPLTGTRVASEATVRAVLSVMATCGMYDSAGDWLFAVGLPAKSGVSGGVMAVVPGELGIGVFSPPLDTRGNSVRGVAVCRDLSREMDLHLVGRGRPRVGPVRARHSVSEIASKRLRSEPDRAILAALGGLAEVRELQGELTFLAAESATRGLADLRQPRWAVLDLSRVDRVGPGAPLLLAGLAQSLRAVDRELLLSGAANHSEAVADIDGVLRSEDQEAIRTFDNADLAREWCEDRVLTLSPADASVAEPAELADHELLHGVDAAGLAMLRGHLRRHCYVPGTVVVRRGDEGEQLFLIMSGRMSVTIDLPDGKVRRLSTLSGGMVFGELALLGREARTADVRADTMVECQVLDADVFERLTVDEPALACTLLANLLRVVSRTARRMTGEVALLAG